MKTERYRHARDYVAALAAAGRHTFTSTEARRALAVSAAASKLALERLAKRGLVASPARGFYVIVPPEYKSLGGLPADQFIPALMQELGLPYYAGLLTAAQYHGAAHQRPQEFQVMLGRARRPIATGKIRVAFFVRRRVRDVPTQDFNTPRGTLRVSTPEATALDLVGYQHAVGGLDQVATTLAELAERIKPDKLVDAAMVVPIPWAQRLGYLLDLVEQPAVAAKLKGYVQSTAKQSVPLLPGVSARTSPRNGDWKLRINTDVEPDQ